jgi:hypothetical protein
MQKKVPAPGLLLPSEDLCALDASGDPSLKFILGTFTISTEHFFFWWGTKQRVSL